MSATGSQQTQTGNLFTDYTYGINTAYSYDVTNYIKYAITDPYNEVNGLLLSPPSGNYQTLFSRIAIGNNSINVPNSKIELQIYYVAVK
jgi:hypothetical protein